MTKQTNKTSVMKMLMTGFIGLLCSTSMYASAPGEGVVTKKAIEAQQQNRFTQQLQPFTTIAKTGYEKLNEALNRFALLKQGSDFNKVLTEQPEYIKMQIPADGRILSLLLYKTSISPNGFTLLTSDNKTASLDVNTVHYRGMLEGDNASLVSFSFSKSETMGLVSTFDGNYIIGKLDDNKENAYIIYNDKDLVPSLTFNCATDVTLPQNYSQKYVPGGVTTATTKCVNWYWEVDNDVYAGKDTATATYMQGIFNQVATLYANDGINIALQTLYIWTTVDPYTGPSTSNYLTQFGNYRTSFAGDLANLIGYAGGGGIAWIDGVCNNQAKYKMAYSGISSTYKAVPLYSWTVEVVAHEEGHLLGSPHTHDCAWNGNNTRIDGCGPAAGYASGSCAAGPIPAKGTIMSYCHLVSGVGIDLNLGFGPQPTALMVDNINTASCLSPCTIGCTPPAQPAAIAGVTATCNGSAVTYSVAAVATATSYIWTLPNGWTGSSTTNTITATAGSNGGTVSVVAVNSCGNSTARTVTVTIGGTAPAQPGTITGAATPCTGASVTYSVASVATATNYIWTLPNGWTGASTTNTITATAGSNGGNISVVAVNSCGNSTARTMSVTIGTGTTPTTPGSISVTGGTGRICPGDARTYTTAAATGVTFNWTVPQGATIVSGQGTNSINVSYNANFTANGVISVVKTNGCATSAARNITITRNTPGTPGVMTGTFTGLCGMNNIIYTVPAVAGMNYIWNVPSGVTINSGQATNSINAGYAATNISGTISVKANNSCGTSAARQMTVKTVPGSATTVNGATSVCANTNGNAYSIAAIPSAVNYTWTGPSGSHIVANGTTSANNILTTTATSVIVNYGAVTSSSKLSVKANNNCGSGNNKTISLSPANCRAGMENSLEETFTVYPNPAHDKVTVSFNVSTGGDYTLTIIEVTGKTVYTSKQQYNAGVTATELDLTKFKKGIYIVQLTNADEVVSKKIVLE